MPVGSPVTDVVVVVEEVVDETVEVVDVDVLLDEVVVVEELDVLEVDVLEELVVLVVVTPTS
jgi:hypothetical protein